MVFINFTVVIVMVSADSNHTREGLMKVPKLMLSFFRVLFQICLLLGGLTGSYLELTCPTNFENLKEHSNKIFL